MLDDEEDVSQEAWNKAHMIVEGRFAAFDDAVDRLKDAWAHDDDADKKFWREVFRGYAKISAQRDFDETDNVAVRLFQVAQFFAGGIAPDLWPDKAAMYEIEQDRKAWEPHGFSPS